MYNAFSTESHFYYHQQELENFISALINGIDYTVDFDFTDYDKKYIRRRVREICGAKVEF